MTSGLFFVKIGVRLEKGDKTMDGNTFQDRILTCCDCGKAFTFEAGEQAYFSRNNLRVPKRCPQCRLLRKMERTPLAHSEKGVQNGNL